MTNACCAAADPGGLFIMKGVSFEATDAPAESSISANSSADCAAKCANALAWTYRANPDTCTCKNRKDSLAAYTRRIMPGATSGIADGIGRVDNGAGRLGAGMLTSGASHDAREWS
jgi:hypothetical protein